MGEGGGVTTKTMKSNRRTRERETAREREREVGDWSYERVVMVTSDHDEVENDQRRLLERKCKYTQKMHHFIGRETPIRDGLTYELMERDSKVYFHTSNFKIQ